MNWLVDFDGSFWEPAYPSGDTPDYAINADIGTMTLVGSDGARYVASDETEPDLDRWTRGDTSMRLSFRRPVAPRP